jgi:hypothetical protein
MTMFVVSFTRRCIVLRIIAGFDAALHIRTFLARSALLKPRRLRAIRPRPLQYNLLVGGVFGLLWKGRDKEDKVPASVKQHLLKAQRALRDGDYEAAEEAYHDALRRLATSEYADAQAYIEARAVVLDKLANVYLEQGKLDKVSLLCRLQLICSCVFAGRNHVQGSNEIHVDSWHGSGYLCDIME